MCQRICLLQSVEDSEHLHPLRPLLEHPLTSDQHHGVCVPDILAWGVKGGGAHWLLLLWWWWGSNGYICRERGWNTVRLESYQRFIVVGKIIILDRQ